MEIQQKFDKVRNFLNKNAGVIALFLIIGFLIFLVLIFFSVNNNSIIDSDSSSDDTASINNENCTVAGINLHGTMLTYIPTHAEGDVYYDYDLVSSEDIVWAIEQANEIENIKAILIEVDSGGGSPVAGEEIANAIRNSEKPVVGYIREMGASAAYWAISSADKIFASKNSNVGAIGITSSYLSNVTKNNKEGLTYEQLSIGKYKDSGSPDKPLTQEERKLFMRDINIVYQNFMEAVSQNRNIPVEKVKSFADGSTVLGEKAKELGLIDEIGNFYEAEKYVEETIGEESEICFQ